MKSNLSLNSFKNKTCHPKVIMRQIKTQEKFEEKIDKLQDKKQKIKFLEQEITAKNTRLVETEKKLMNHLNSNRDMTGSITESDILSVEVEELRRQLNQLQKFHLKNSMEGKEKNMSVKEQVLSVIEGVKLQTFYSPEVKTLIYSIMDEITRATEENSDFKFDENKMMKLVVKYNRSPQNKVAEQQDSEPKASKKRKLLTIKTQQADLESANEVDDNSPSLMSTPKLKSLVRKKDEEYLPPFQQASRQKEISPPREDRVEREQANPAEEPKSSKFFEDKYVPPSQRIKQREMEIRNRGLNDSKVPVARNDDDEISEMSPVSHEDGEEKENAEGSKFLTPAQLKQRRRKSDQQKTERVSSSNYHQEQPMKNEDASPTRSSSSSMAQSGQKSKIKKKQQSSKKEIKLLETFRDFINEADNSQNLTERIKIICDAEEAYTILGGIALSQLYSYVTKPFKAKKAIIKLLQSWIKSGIPR